MRQIKNANLAQLLAQLRFSPAKQRARQLAGAEKLLAIIDKSKDYPFDFVCYHITGYHPKSDDQSAINGRQLADDLSILIARLSSQVAAPAQQQGQKVYTIQQLAEQMGVSTKTIDRWRNRGLVAKKFIFADGQKLLGFSQSGVDNFIKANSRLVEKAGQFSQLSQAEKEEIMALAAKPAAAGKQSRYQIIRQVADQTGRAVETVRYTILNYEKNGSGKSVFKKPFGQISPTTAAEIYRLYKQGSPLSELMARFARSKSSIYRIINARRARALLAKRIEFIASDEFVADGAGERILGQVLPQRTGRECASSGVAGTGQQYPVAGAGVPNRQVEQELFRRYNYLKYLACVERARLNPAGVYSGQLKRIEGYLEQAEEIKKTLIEVNLGLVAGIAAKHTAGGANLQELVGVGNLSLVQSLEKFDYTRGFRFATYASWAITKDFARKMPAQAERPEKPPHALPADVQRDMRTVSSAGVVAIERARQSLIEVIRENLDPREQHIVLNHFGLVGSLVKKQKKTLAQIGEDLGLTKERVRQIELLALQKLRQLLSIEEFELLTG